METRRSDYNYLQMIWNVCLENPGESAKELSQARREFNKLMVQLSITFTCTNGHQLENVIAQDIKGKKKMKHEDMKPKTTFKHNYNKRDVN